MGAYTPEERAASNFSNDLADAKPAEDFILEVFSRLNKDCWYVASEGYEPRGDMFCSHCRQWVEVKYDHLYGKTGNVFVEVDTLKHTEAKYFVVVVEKWATTGDNYKPTGQIDPFIYVMDMEKLKEACRELWRKGKKPVAAGEFKKMTGYPLPLKALQKTDWVITIMTKATEKYASTKPIAELFKQKYNRVHGGTTETFRQRNNYR